MAKVNFFLNEFSPQKINENDSNSLLLVFYIIVCYNKTAVNKGGKIYGNKRYYS